MSSSFEMGENKNALRWLKFEKDYKENVIFIRLNRIQCLSFKNADVHVLAGGLVLKWIHSNSTMENDVADVFKFKKKIMEAIKKMARDNHSRGGK